MYRKQQQLWMNSYFGNWWAFIWWFFSLHVYSICKLCVYSACFWIPKFGHVSEVRANCLQPFVNPVLSFFSILSWILIKILENFEYSDEKQKYVETSENICTSPPEWSFQAKTAKIIFSNKYKKKLLFVIRILGLGTKVWHYYTHHL